MHNVTMRECDSSYITPRIQLLLRNCNKLRRAGRVEHADNLGQNSSMYCAQPKLNLGWCENQ